jgi:hypothetical protein
VTEAVPGWREITVAYDPARVTPEEVLHAAQRTGYTIRLSPGAR